MATENSGKLYKELKKRGFREELCREIAYRQMNTDYTSTRMLGYLYARGDLREEELIDEMLAILADRDSLVKKHEAQRAQAGVSELYRKGLM